MAHFFNVTSYVYIVDISKIHIFLLEAALNKYLLYQRFQTSSEFDFAMKIPVSIITILDCPSFLQYLNGRKTF